MPSNNARRDVGILLGLIFVMWLCLYWPVLWGSEVMFFRDIGHTYYPFHTFLKESLWRGELPLWNPYSFTGTPQIAAAEPAVLYPGTWLFFIFDFQRALILGLLLHQWLLGAGMYLLGQAYKWGSAARVFAAFMAAFSGVVVSLNNLHPLLFTYAWLPLMIWGVHQLFQQDDKKYVWFVALFYALQVLSGHFDLVYFNSLLALSYGAFLAFQLKKVRPLVDLLGAFLIGVLGGAVQLLPTLEFLSYSTRSQGVALQSAQLWSFHPLRWVSFFLPNIWGDVYSHDGLLILGDKSHGYSFLIMNVYMGSTGLFLVTYGFKRLLQWPMTLFWGGVSVFVLLWASGSYLPLYQMIYEVLPGLSSFRYPVKLILYWAFIWALLVGFAFDDLLKDIKKTTALPLVGISLILGGLVCFVYWGQTFYEASFYKGLVWLTGNQSDYLQFTKWLEKYRLFCVQQLSFIAFLFAFWGAVTWRAQKKRTQMFVVSGFVCLFGEFYFAHHMHVLSLPRETFFQPSAVKTTFLGLGLDKNLAERFIQSYYYTHPFQSKSHRLPDFNVDAQKMMGLNYPLLFGFHGVHSIWAARPEKLDRLYISYISAVDAPTPASDVFRHQFEVMTAAKYIYDLNSPSAMSGFLERHPEWYAKIKDYPADNASIWENKNFQPRVHFKYQSAVLETEQEMADIMGGKSNLPFAPGQYVMLLKDAAYAQALAETPSSEARDKRWSPPEIVSETNNTLKIRFDTNTSGYVVLADTHYPGWKAYDNGQERPILKANYYQRAVRVGPGKHELEFRYEPLSFLWGAVVSGVSFVLLLMGVIWGLKRKGWADAV